MCCCCDFCGFGRACGGKGCAAAPPYSATSAASGSAMPAWPRTRLLTCDKISSVFCARRRQRQPRVRPRLSAGGAPASRAGAASSAAQSRAAAAWLARPPARRPQSAPDASRRGPAPQPARGSLSLASEQVHRTCSCRRGAARAAARRSAARSARVRASGGAERCACTQQAARRTEDASYAAASAPLEPRSAPRTWALRPRPTWRTDGASLCWR